jgi:UDP-N-acetylmuramoylalanine--D-glutamate ligase
MTAIINSGMSSSGVESVHHARSHAQPGDVVLLAPACASFDQFENYEQRGSVFKQIVAELF